MAPLEEKIINILKSHYRHGGVTLQAETPFQLLIATILSAQCTDERVNKVCKILFSRFETAEALSKADVAMVSEIIKSLGFYNQKAKNIVETAKRIVTDFKGKVPDDRELLESLPGVGRKTANIILSRVFNVPAIAVDTHVKRLSSRIFGIKDKSPEKIERRLMEILDKRLWNDVNLTFIFHGRAICKPRKPLCSQCPVKDYCKYFIKKGESR